MIDTGTAWSPSREAGLRAVLHDEGPRRGIGPRPGHRLRDRSQAGGYVEINSEVGLGTVFTMFLPARPTGEPRSRRPATRARDRGSTILVVEDEPAMREVTRRILERHGHRVLVAASGAKPCPGGAATRTDRPAADRRDHAGDARQAGRRGGPRAQPGVGVLFMSGYARPVLTSDGTLEPGVVLMEKPFTEAALLDSINEVLAHPRVITGIRWSAITSATISADAGERVA